MDTYSALRGFADSWMLLFLTLFFIGVIVWVLTRNSNRYSDVKKSIFRHEDRPVGDADPKPQDVSASDKGKETRP